MKEFIENAKFTEIVIFESIFKKNLINFKKIKAQKHKKFKILKLKRIFVSVFKKKDHDRLTEIITYSDYRNVNFPL